MANTFGLPNNLYLSGAAQPLNLTPFMTFYMNQQARQRAKDEALEQYYSNFTKSVNPAGMRTQDIENGWSQKVSDWQDFYRTNKASILKPKLDNGKALNEFQSRYQDILQDTQKSKSATENIKQIFPILSDPDKRSRLSESTLGSISNADKSIYDEGYKPIDYTSINFSPKELTANDLEGFNKYFTNGLKMSEGNPSIITDPKTKSKVLTTESAYTDKDLGIIADRAEKFYGENAQFANFINGMINEKDYNELNKVFKEVYKEDIDITHPEEFAAAWALKNNQQKVTNTSTAGYSPTTINIKNNKEVNPTGLIDNYISNIYANAQPMPYKYSDGRTEKHYRVQPNPQLSEIFASKTGAGSVYPDHIEFLPNGDVLPIFYKLVKKDGKLVVAYSDDKQKAAVDKELSVPISKYEFKMRLANKLLGEKNLLKYMNENNQNTVPSNSSNKKSSSGIQWK